MSLETWRAEAGMGATPHPVMLSWPRLEFPILFLVPENI